jgi:phosphopantetheinyl transferase
VLSYYLDCAPTAISYARQTGGKPILTHHALHFNLARRNGRCAIALSRTQPVGVDIEQIQPLAGMDDMAALYFSHAACQALNPLSGVAKQRRFFELWTALEARAKCQGTGLAQQHSANLRVTHSWLDADWLIALAIQNR